jgi:hypothetical protein
MLKIDKKTVAYLEEKRVRKIKVFFYTAGCSGNKVDILADDFELGENLTEIPLVPSPLL